MAKTDNLAFECMAIGSLPHLKTVSAINLIKRDFNNIPFWPQLVKINKNEDMLYQFLEGMPSFFNTSDKLFLDCDYETFGEDLENFFNDYEEIISDLNSHKLETYQITKSIAFKDFTNLISQTRPNYAKGQIVGPFTLASTLCTQDETPVIYDETLREIVLKTLTLKALWQINKIKTANSTTIPIIFIDEPSLSQLGTSAYVGISKDEVVAMLHEISNIIEVNGGIPALHCCGKCDWTIPIQAGVKIINPDAYAFAENLSLFSESIENFLRLGGKIAWGIVPTLDKHALEQINLSELIKHFNSAIKYLTNKGIDEKLIILNSLITPSCGAGGLSIELAEKAMDLTKMLSVKLKEIYSIGN